MHFQSFLYSSLLLASTASARPQSMKRSVLRKLPFKTGDGACDASQRATIQLSFEHALTMIDNVIDTASKDSIPFRTFMDNSGSDANFKAVKNVYSDIQLLLTDSSNKLTITCDGDDDGCEFDTLAWATKDDRRINYCNNYFRTSVLGAIREWSLIPDFEDIQCKGKSIDFDKAGIKASQIDKLKYMPASTTVHELAHLFGNERAIKAITDCYYNAYAAEYMAMKKPVAAMGNADNYAWFAVSQYMNTLCGNPDTTIYRAWEDQTHLVFDDSFHSQYIKLEAKKQAADAAEKLVEDLTEAAKTPDNARVLALARYKAEVETNGVASAATMKQIEIADTASAKIHTEIYDAKKKLGASSVYFCSTGRTWAQIQADMKARKTKV